MPLDTSLWVGRNFPPHQITVTKDMLTAFATAVEEADMDEAPPTFPIYLDLSAPEAADRLSSLGIPLLNVLHAEQAFTSHRPIVAGMRLSCRTRLTKLSEKKEGALLFVTFETSFSDEAGVAATMIFTIAVRNTP
jgi:hypothetical protein